MYKSALLLGLSTTAILLFTICSNTPVAGGGTEDVNTRVTAVVVNSSGTPVANAQVRIRRSNYVSALPGMAKTTIYAADAITDAHGKFEVFGVDSGRYIVEITDRFSSAVMASCHLEHSDSADLGVLTMSPIATISGCIDTTDRSMSSMYIQAEGLEHVALVNDTGGFVLTGLPAGSIIVRTVIAPLRGGNPTVLRSDPVTAVAGATVHLPMTGWRFSKRLYLNTLATGANVASNVTNFPLLIRLDSSHFKFSQAQADGSDLRFIDVQGITRAYEIEQWDSATSRAAIWVQMDTVRGNDDQQFIVMYWGNASIVSSVSNSAAVFDTAKGFAGVWHLGEPGSVVRKNATGSGHDGTALGYDGDESTLGMVGNCDSIGGNDGINVGNLNVDRAITLSAWIKASEVTGWHYIISKCVTGGLDPYFVYTLRISDKIPPRAEILLSASASLYNGTASTSGVYPDQWIYVVGTFDGNNIAFYFNGFQEVSRSLYLPFLEQNNRDTYLGYDEDAPAMRFTGKMDEVRIEKVARSQAWVKLCYENQKQNQGLLEYNQ